MALEARPKQSLFLFCNREGHGYINEQLGRASGWKSMWQRFMERVVEETGVSIGVIATPAASAQHVCDLLVAAGITSILNFAPVVLQVPDGVDLRKVDLALELQILSFHQSRRTARPMSPMSPMQKAAGVPA